MELETELERIAQLEFLQDRVEAQGLLLERLLSTIPPDQRESMFEQARQSLLRHPRAQGVASAVNSIQLRSR